MIKINYLHIFFALFFFIGCSNENYFSLVQYSYILDELEPNNETLISIDILNETSSILESVIIKPACGCYVLQKNSLKLYKGESENITFPFTCPKLEGDYKVTFIVEGWFKNSEESVVHSVNIFGKVKKKISVYPEIINNIIDPSIKSYCNTIKFDIESNSGVLDVELMDISIDVDNKFNVYGPFIKDNTRYFTLYINDINRFKKDNSSINFKIITDSNNRIIEIPIRFYDKKVSINPSIATLSKNSSSLFLINSPSNNDLLKVSSKFSNSISLKKICANSFTSLYLARVNPSEDFNNKYDVIKFLFSNESYTRNLFYTK